MKIYSTLFKSRNDVNNLYSRCFWKNRLTLFSIFMSSIGLLIAQEVPNAPSPNIASLGQYITNPVSYYTGIPEINIPLYEYKDQDVSIPISLSYQASAFKPDEHPSWVGMGWSLNAGGYITRIVKGRRDDALLEEDLYDKPDQASAWMNYYDNIEHFVDNRLFESKNLANCETFDRYEGLLLDGEPDEFVFSFGKYSGKFIFSKAKGNIAPVVMGYSDLKVEVHPWLINEKFERDNSDGINYLSFKKYAFSGFTITTPDGMRYEFGCKRTDNMNNIQNADELAVDETQICPDLFYTRYIDTWHLVRISKLGKTNEEIEIATFEYNRGEQPGYPTTRKKHLNINWSVSYIRTESELVDNNGNQLVSLPFSYNITYPRYLSKINTKNGSIIFSTSDSKELSNRKINVDFGSNSTWNNIFGGSSGIIGYLQLDKIEIKDQMNKTINFYNFDYTKNEFERLRLLKLTEAGKPPYLFDYDNLGNRFLTNSATDPFLPSGYQIPYGVLGIVDKFGFYNQFTGETNPPRLPDFFKLLKPINVISQTLDFQNASSCCFNMAEVDEYMKDENNQYITRKEDRISKFENALKEYDTYCPPGNLSFNLNKIIYPTSGYTKFVYEPHQYEYLVRRNVESDQYLQKYDYPISTSGLRLKEISMFDKDNTLINKKSYTYEMGIQVGNPSMSTESNCSVNTLNSTVIYENNWGFETYEVNPGNVTEFPLFGKGYVTGYNPTTFKSFSFNTISRMPLSNNGSGSHIGYSKITENTTGNGKTVFYYHNFKDDPTLYSQQELNEFQHFHFDYSYLNDEFEGFNETHKQMILDKYTLKSPEEAPNSESVFSCFGGKDFFQLESFQQLRGRLIGHDIFNESGIKVESIRNKYELIAERDVDYYTNASHSMIESYTNLLIKENKVYSPSSYIFQINFPYKIFYNPIILSNTTTNLITPTGAIKKETLYRHFFDYENQPHNISYSVGEEQKNSNGEKLINQYQNISNWVLQNSNTNLISTDYGKLLKAMDEKGLGMLPLMQQKIITKTDSISYLLNRAITTYGNFVNAGYKPKSYYSLNTISNTEYNYPWVTYNPTINYFQPKFPPLVESDISNNSSYELGLEFKSYNQKGSPQEIVLKDGVNATYLWSYNGAYLIAEIKNVTSAEVSAALSGISPEQLANAVVPDMAKVEALRTALTNAMVTTYTYKPLVGMLTATDPRGVTTYYDYDSSNRLKQTYIIENGEKKILQKYDYHYVNQ